MPGGIKMVNITVQCPVCGYEFGSGVVVEGATDTTLVGNQVQCPNCGTMVPIDDRFIRKS